MGDMGLVLAILYCEDRGREIREGIAPMIKVVVVGNNGYWG